jgi:hypothetical protein
MPYATDAHGPKKGYNHGKSIKNSATYEALITKQGMSKGQAAAISNAALNKGARKGRHHKKSHA